MSCFSEQMINSYKGMVDMYMNYCFLALSDTVKQELCNSMINEMNKNYSTPNTMNDFRRCNRRSLFL